MRYLRETVTQGRVHRGWTLARQFIAGHPTQNCWRGSDLSAHEPATLDVDVVSFTDVTTGRSDHTYYPELIQPIAAPGIIPELALPVWAGYREQMRSRLAQIKMKSAQ